MKLFTFLLIVMLNLSINTMAGEVPVSQHLQDISVTIKSSNSEGSGVLFTRKDANGELINLIWTAGHCVESLRNEREVISQDGTKRMIVEFQDARVVKEILENGRRVGRLELDAEVLRYSDSANAEDLAVLKLRKKNFVTSSVKFYIKEEIPALGTSLYHVGSLLGQLGANSMTSGIYSQQGRLIGKNIFDQTTVAAFPGSSGGGVYLVDGQYVGMLVRGAGETFNLIVPIRRMIEWAKKSKIEWAINESIPMPSYQELEELPIEDIGKTFKRLSIGNEKDNEKSNERLEDLKTLIQINSEDSKTNRGEEFKLR